MADRVVYLGEKVSVGDAADNPAVSWNDALSRVRAITTNQADLDWLDSMIDNPEEMTSVGMGENEISIVKSTMTDAELVTKGKTARDYETVEAEAARISKSR